MTNEKTNIVVLLSTHSGSCHKPFPGTKVLIADCGHEAYISPASQAMVEASPTGCVTVCDSCVPKGRLNNPAVKKYFVPGSTKEMTELLGTSVADQVIAKAREAGVRDMP